MVIPGRLLSFMSEIHAGQVIGFRIAIKHIKQKPKIVR